MLEASTPLGIPGIPILLVATLKPAPAARWDSLITPVTRERHRPALTAHDRRVTVRRRRSDACTMR